MKKNDVFFLWGWLILFLILYLECMNYCLQGNRIAAADFWKFGPISLPRRMGSMDQLSRRDLRGFRGQPSSPDQDTCGTWAIRSIIGVPKNASGLCAPLADVVSDSSYWICQSEVRTFF